MDVVGSFFAFVAIGLSLLFIYLIGEAILRRRKQKDLEPTPEPEVDITEYDELPPGVAVTLAWFETGEDPIKHYKQQDAIRAHMPVLGRALDRMHND